MGPREALELKGLKECLNLKETQVVFLQETHSNEENETCGGREIMS